MHESTGRIYDAAEVAELDAKTRKALVPIELEAVQSMDIEARKAWATKRKAERKAEKHARYLARKKR